MVRKIGRVVFDLLLIVTGVLLAKDSVYVIVTGTFPPFEAMPGLPTSISEWIAMASMLIPSLYAINGGVRDFIQLYRERKSKK